MKAMPATSLAVREVIWWITFDLNEFSKHQGNQILKPSNVNILHIAFSVDKQRTVDSNRSMACIKKRKEYMMLFFRTENAASIDATVLITSTDEGRGCL